MRIISAVSRHAIARIESIEKCSEELEIILGTEKTRLQKGSKVNKPSGDEEYDSLYAESLAEDWHRLDKEIPSVIRSALFTKAVSEFEMIMMSLAKRHIKLHKLTFDLKDIRDDGLRKVRLFFTKFTDYGFPEKPDLWEEISKLAEIRNFVLHSEGRIPAERIRDFAKYKIKWEPNVVFDENGKILFGDEAVSMATRLYREFIVCFFRAYKEK